jgi:LPS sulfotransferase NodH
MKTMFGNVIHNKNAIYEYLCENNVTLPNVPLDLSSRFADVGVERSYVILMSGRTGSTWLAEALKQIDGFGNPREYFSEQALPYFGDFSSPQSFEEFFLGIIKRNSKSGCFGFKANPQRLFAIQSSLDIAKTFAPSNCKWIYMTRWNIVKQALSFVRAKTSGKWHDFSSAMQNNETEITEAILPSMIWREIISILKQEKLAEDFFETSGIKPLRIFYEEIFDSRRQLLMRVSKHISGSTVDVSVLNRMNDATRKLNDLTIDNAEDDFVLKYSSELNEIYQGRISISLAQLEEWHRNSEQQLSV